MRKIMFTLMSISLLFSLAVLTASAKEAKATGASKVTAAQATDAMKAHPSKEAKATGASKITAAQATDAVKASQPWQEETQGKKVIILSKDGQPLFEIKHAVGAVDVSQLMIGDASLSKNGKAYDVNITLAGKSAATLKVSSQTGQLILNKMSKTPKKMSTAPKGEQESGRDTQHHRR